MSPEAEAVLDWGIGEILRNFAIHCDYGASAAAGRRLYAVWDSRRSPSRKVTEPAPHLAAKADLNRLQTEAIIQLIKEHDANARAAD